MTKQDLEEIARIIGDDKRYRHFIDSVTKDFQNSQLKGIPVAMHSYYIKEGRKNVGFCVLSLSPLKMRQWEEVFKEEGWVDEDFKINISSFELMYLYIKPQFRRQGKATELLDKVIKKTRSLGIESIYTYVSEIGEAALKFYLKNGAQVIYNFSDNDTHSAYLMWRL